MAAASLGTAVGSAAGGLLFDVASLPNASSMLMTVLIAVGILISLGLPNMLVARTVDNDSDDTEALSR